MSNKSTILDIGEILTSTNAMKVLWFMLSHPDEEYYDRQISSFTGISRAGTNLALRELSNAGLLIRMNRGRMAFYHLIKDDPLIAQLKIVQTLTTLREFIQAIREHTIRIVLYGSAAIGEDTSSSDWDLFVLSREPKKIHAELAKIELEERIQLIVHTPTEWARIRKENKVFVEQIEKGMVLWDETLQRNSNTH